MRLVLVLGCAFRYAALDADATRLAPLKENLEGFAGTAGGMKPLRGAIPWSGRIIGHYELGKCRGCIRGKRRIALQIREVYVGCKIAQAEAAIDLVAFEPLMVRVGPQMFLLGGAGRGRGMYPRSRW